MRTSARGIALIKEFEGFRAKAYQDAVGVWTIGYGFTRGVKPGDTITREQAETRLRDELGVYERGVIQATHGRATQAQFDALVSFAFNVGVAGMSKSTVIKRHNEGNYQAAARAFGLWNKAGGRVLNGLTRRRAAESALYLTPEPVHEEEPVSDMTHEVEPERPMAASQINRAGVMAGGAAAVATATEVAQQVGTVKSAADMLGSWLVPVLLLAVAGLCAYIVWERVKQRKEGWA